MAFQWTNENVFTLLDMFEERELLWNTALEDYRDRNKKHNAWGEIATAFGVDNSIVEKKMKSLIGQFQRELKKVESDTECDEVPKWFAFKRMMFLKDRKKPGKGSDVGVKEKSDNNEEGGSGSLFTLTIVEKESDIEKQQTFASPSHSTCRKRIRPQEESSEEALIMKELHGPRPKRDEFDVFGELVGVKLRNLNNSHAKHTAQYHINKILYNAAIGEYDWPSCSSSPSSYHGTASNSGHDCKPEH